MLCGGHMQSETAPIPDAENFDIRLLEDDYMMKTAKIACMHDENQPKGHVVKQISIGVVPTDHDVEPTMGASDSQEHAGDRETDQHHSTHDLQAEMPDFIDDIINWNATEDGKVTTTESSPNTDPTKTSSHERNMTDPVDDANPLWEEKSGVPPLANHRIACHDQIQETVSDPIEQMESLDINVPIIMDTNNGEVIVIEESEDEKEDIMDINVPIITDTNNGEVIVIEDSEDEKEDITANQRTWSGSQRRVWSKPLHPIVKWSGKRFERANRTAMRQLWINVKTKWSSIRALTCFSGIIRAEIFNRIIMRVDERAQGNDDMISCLDANRLQRNFAPMLRESRRKPGSSSRQGAMDDLGCALKDLATVVKRDTLIKEHSTSDVGKDDGY
jgi:hypothetical protein